MHHCKMLPKWLTANCCSMLSFDSVNGGAIIPALLLSTPKARFSSVFYKPQIDNRLIATNNINILFVKT